MLIIPGPRRGRRARRGRSGGRWWGSRATWAGPPAKKQNWTAKKNVFFLFKMLWTAVAAWDEIFWYRRGARRAERRSHPSQNIRVKTSESSRRGEPSESAPPTRPSRTVRVRSQGPHVRAGAKNPCRSVRIKRENIRASPRRQAAPRSARNGVSKHCKSEWCCRSHHAAACAPEHRTCARKPRSAGAALRSAGSGTNQCSAIKCCCRFSPCRDMRMCCARKRGRACVSPWSPMSENSAFFLPCPPRCRRRRRHETYNKLNRRCFSAAVLWKEYQHNVVNVLAASVMARSVRAPSTHARTHLLSPTYTATTFDELIFGSEWYSNRND